MMEHKRFLPSFLIVATLVLAVMACQSIAELPNPFATATPTLTFTPTSTPTPLPTATATATPTPLPTGVKAEKQSDGTTLIIDYDNKYHFSLSSGWIVIPLSGEDLASSLQELTKMNPDLSDAAKSFEQLDPKAVRVVAINTDRKYMPNGYAANITVIVLENRLAASLPIDFLLATMEDDLEHNHAKILPKSTTVGDNVNGVEFGNIEFLQAIRTAYGNNVQARCRSVIFQSNNKLVIITLATLQQFGEELSPVMDHIADSITLLKP